MLKYFLSSTTIIAKNEVTKMTDNMNKTIATILKVVNEKGNRIYKLNFSKAIDKKSDCVLLSIDGFEGQKPFFFHVENNSVVVNVHHCIDLEEQVYYAWQPRLPTKASACPRCKTRIDFSRTSR